MRVTVVKEDNFVFFIEPPAYGKNDLPSSPNFLTINDIQKVQEIIDAMITFLLKKMEPRYRKELSDLLDIEYCEISYQEGFAIVM